MRMNAYFDTNVFDHISKGIGVKNTDSAVLRSAIKTGTISIVLSYLNLEEALSALQQSASLALAQLRLVLELAEERHFVKPLHMLLADDIRCYAEGKALLEPFIALDLIIQSNLRTLLIAPERIDELLSLIKETQKQKEDFMDAMRKAGAEVLPSAKKFLRDNHGRPPEWQVYWDRLAEGFAEGFAVKHDLDLCRKRGIKGLLEVRSVKMAAGSSVSFAYAETFEKRTPKLGDSRDLQHAVLASAADVFVTHDRNLARLLQRIPQVCFQIMELSELLDHIKEKRRLKFG